jgi:N-acetyl-gamma-glutamyl-phosphate reductase
MSDKIQAVILGASGYVAGEFLRLIAGHPHYELAAAVSASRAGAAIADTFPHLGGVLGNVSFTAPDAWPACVAAGEKIALFSAAPHGASAALIADALAAIAARGAEAHAVDTSADFRYAAAADYEAVYGGPHGAPELLADFSCAVPEHAAQVDTPHVGHPGCFATATLLTAVPLVASGLAGADLYVTGITGSTGSGRQPQAGTHHPERHSNLYAYKPLAHRHAPEIAALLRAAGGRDVGVHFVPHSGPFARGIHVTVQAQASRSVTAGELLDVYRRAYAGARFVTVVDGMPRLKSVVTSNHCQIGVAAAGGTVAVTGVIDNLVKGAAGGAVQWMNRLFGLAESAGLDAAATGWI